MRRAKPAPTHASSSGTRAALRPRWPGAERDASTSRDLVERHERHVRTRRPDGAATSPLASHPADHARRPPASRSAGRRAARAWRARRASASASATSLDREAARRRGPKTNGVSTYGRAQSPAVKLDDRDVRPVAAARSRSSSAGPIPDERAPRTSGRRRPRARPRHRRPRAARARAAARGSRAPSTRIGRWSPAPVRTSRRSESTVSGPTERSSAYPDRPPPSRGRGSPGGCRSPPGWRPSTSRRRDERERDAGDREPRRSSYPHSRRPGTGRRTTSPPATIAPNRSRGAVDRLQPAPDDEQVEQEQDRGAEEAALLGERGEREVGRVLGQVVEPASGSPRRRRARAGRPRRRR